MCAKILIVDDDQEIQELLKFTLEDEHHQVISAEDGEAGVRMATGEHPDLIILDVNMPKLSGFEVLEKIRENGSTCLTPVIMLTSQAKTKDRITGIKLGADEYLNKPFEPFEIVARVEGLLKRTRESLAANPLTGFPGNPSIETEIKRRLEAREVFSVVYSDIDNFKAFNDKYGFEKGDNIIRLLSVIIRSAITEFGDKNDFLGHIGGGDFVIVSTETGARTLCEKIIQNFDAFVPNKYDEESMAKGFIMGVNRSGAEEKFPLMTVSLGVAVVEPGKYKHYSQVVERAKELLKKAKLDSSSVYVVG